DRLSATDASWQLQARHAQACLGAGDHTAYRRVCTVLLERVGGMDQPAVLSKVAGTCLLGPQAVADYTGLVHALQRAVVADPSVGTFRHLLGGMLYRSGQWEDASEQLNAVRQTRQHKEDGGTVSDWLFLAMAHQRLGHGAEA